ncbi:hypothetical protein MHU86_18167 [Fragilaria crotonensis]|nr:hypothetical protein MHU86_18167 [Fragilaria crotonensis]
MLSIKTLPVVATILWLSVAVKDSDYYPPGVSNPNVNQKMYWKDAVNVLQDLDQFESLHILFHGCVWSKYGGRYGNNQDDNGDQNIDVNNGCGGDGGEYFWYLGQTQCFRANVAYSLYGVLKGASHSGNFCQKSTYINSFFTTYGIESFGGPLGLDIDTANSYCTTQEPENGQNEYYVDEIDDDYLSSNAEFINYQAYTSFGTGCSAGKFVTDKYSGAFCRGDLYIETLDTLDSFNSAIESLGCTQIYSRSNSGGRELEDNDYDFADQAAVSVLSFSTACDIRQYPQECPDPYGKKVEYASNMERSLSGIAMTSRSPMHTVTNFCAFLFVMFGLLFVAMAYNVHSKAARKSKTRGSNAI